MALVGGGRDVGGGRGHGVERGACRVPEVLIFSTIQPVMFVLLFRYVFGGSIDTGQPGGYVQLLMPGIFVQTVAFTLAGTASGLAEDMKKGLIDCFTT